MKKLLIITSAILLLAAACNKQAAVEPGQDQQQTTTADQGQSNTSFITNPSLAMTLGTYSQRKRIIIAIDVYYSDNKKLPTNYSALVSAGLLTNSSPDIDFLPYLEYKNVSNTQIYVCLKFKA